jgi:2,3-bisphosphoglycerate-dependent phosphoglycerate mutase
MKLYLIRHAQSANNEIYSPAGNEPGRHPDPEITEAGHRQAGLLAAHFAQHDTEPRQPPFQSKSYQHYGLTHLYCSLMSRSILTAEYVARACNLPLQALPDIFEKYGMFEFDQAGIRQGVAGPARAYFEERFPTLSLPDELGEKGWWRRPTESDQAFVQRVKKAMKDIRQRHCGENDRVGLVVHGDFIDQCINTLMGVKRSDKNYNANWEANWVSHNTSISRIDFINGSHNVIYLNRIDHLPADLVTW